MPGLQPESITHVIQLAIAPVFLLNAVGALIGVQTTRLARAVDRTRAIEERPGDGAAMPISEAQHAELDVLRRRMRLIYLALVLDVVCALFVGLVIVAAFAAAFVALDLSRPIALLFVAAMLAFIASMLVFLREIFLAVRGTAQLAAPGGRAAVLRESGKHGEAL